MGKIPGQIKESETKNGSKKNSPLYIKKDFLVYY
jgi:hypothetical protein